MDQEKKERAVLKTMPTFRSALRQCKEPPVEKEASARMNEGEEENVRCLRCGLAFAVPDVEAGEGFCDYCLHVVQGDD